MPFGSSYVAGTDRTSRLCRNSTSRDRLRRGTRTRRRAPQAQVGDDAVEIAAVLGREIPGRDERDSPIPGRAQPAIGVGERVQPFSGAIRAK